MPSPHVQVESLSELDGFLFVRGFAFDPATRGPAPIDFLDGPTGERLEVLGPRWDVRPEVALVHGLTDDRVGFRAMVASPWEPGRPFYDPARLTVTAGRGSPSRPVVGRVRAVAARALGRPSPAAEGRPAVDLFPAPLGGADPVDRLVDEFMDRLRGLTGGAVLEIGSRARSDIVRRDCVSSGVEYVGVDVVDGPNVDVVADAHRLSEVLPRAHFTHAFAISVWEHLLVPWKVSLELNAVLADGGEVLVQSHQTWPVHDRPADYWRFSEWSWRALFNQDTGFEIVEAVMGIPGRVLVHQPRGGIVGMAAEPAYLGSSVVARKVGPPRVSWDTGTDELGAHLYPA